MSLPPSIRTLLPSFQIDEDKGAVTLALVDLKRQLPSLTARSNGRDFCDDLTITLSTDDLRRLLRVALADVPVDEKWYVEQVPGLEEDLEAGAFSSAAEHYYFHGYLEGRLPQRPKVDEDYYFKTYPDVAEAVKSGEIKSGYEHFLTAGYAEGRMPLRPPDRG
jgi:hypothetical protein